MQHEPPLFASRLFDGPPVNDDLIEHLNRRAIQAAWAAQLKHPKADGIKAAREAIAIWRPKPLDLAAMARTLSDYGHRPDVASDKAKKVEWLTVGSGCTKRTGTFDDAQSASWSALYATNSILLELPVDCIQDEAALLDTLKYARWRVPPNLRKQTAHRFARFVANQIDCSSRPCCHLRHG